MKHDEGIVLAREVLSHLHNKKVCLFVVVLNREIKLEGTLIGSSMPFLEVEVNGVTRVVNVFAVKEIFLVN